MSGEDVIHSACQSPKLRPIGLLILPMPANNFVRLHNAEVIHMKHKNGININLPRRDFIKTTAIGAGTTVLAGLEAKDVEAKGSASAHKWGKEADVVVVGYGGAGVVTAITAHDAGAKVLILEKAPIEGGGCTRMAGGQAAFTEPSDVAGAAEYLFTACLGTTPMDICRAWAEEISNNDDWLTAMGMKWVKMGIRPGFKNNADFQNFPGASALKLLAINGGGPSFFKAMDKHIRNRGIEILFDTPGAELIQDSETKEIVGVKAVIKGKDIFIKARKAVVLCTGGFDFNEEMKSNFLRPYPIKFTGWRYNTGDGIKMAQSVGADLWHMNVIASAGQTVVTSASEIGWMYTRAMGENYIWVNRYGKRFACESPTWFDHRASMGYDIWDWSDTQKDARYPCIPFYLIFDEKTRLAGPIGGGFGSQMGVMSIPVELGGIAEKWSDDNSKEIGLGWVKKGNTIRELAKEIGAITDPDQLEKSVESWNGFCATGKDQEFGRKEKLGPITTPPFYAVEMYPGGFSTCGGPRKNIKSQVLDTKRNPIPRLYTAGVLGSTAGHIYGLAGHNWAEFMAFGRIAGRNAAAEKPWC
jgi:succinate dehydrogenase/fumarate reductase flavoprotein subunit